eukprot:19562-Heterococcus_DN1.PRE.2
MAQHDSQATISAETSRPVALKLAQWDHQQIVNLQQRQAAPQVQERRAEVLHHRSCQSLPLSAALPAEVCDEKPKLRRALQLVCAN